MPPTRPGTSIIGPSFFHRAARDLVGRLIRQGARFAAIPHAMMCFGARGGHHEHPARVQRPIRHRQAHADVFGGREGYRKAARNDADDARWKASKRLPRTRNDAGHGGGRGRDQAGRGVRTRTRMLKGRVGPSQESSRVL